MSGIGASMGKLGTMAATGLAAGAVAGVAAAGAIGAAWLSVSSEIDQSQRSLQAQLGITASEAKELGQIGQDVFANNWGGSIDEASAAVGEVKKLFGSLAGDELQAVTEQAFAMNAAFGGDLQSTLAGAQRLAGAFGVTAGEAMDILAKGAQVTGEPLQEVSLLFQEYSGHLAQLGIDGPAALSAIQSGMAAGAFEGDKVLDMFKEMNLKLTEGSTATQGALGKLGLTGLIEDFRAGEVTGVEAFQKIQAALGQFEGNIPADILADALGTPAEDLGQEAVLAIDLMGTSLGNLEGTAKAAGDAMSSSIGGALEGLKRNAMLALAGIGGGEAFGAFKDRAIEAINIVSGSLSSLADGDVWAFVGEIGMAIEAFTGLTGVEDMFDSLGSMLQDFIGHVATAVGWINQIVEKLGGWSTVIGVVATALAAFGIITTVIGWVSGLMAAWASLGAGITAAGGIIGAIIAVLGGPLTIAIAAVAAIVAGLALAWKNDWGGMRDKVAEIVGWIQANVVPAIQAAFGQVQAVLGNLVAWWQANGAEVIAVVSGIVSFVVQQFEFLFNILSNVVKAGIALITGDWRGLGEAVGSIIGNMIAAWVSMFKGIIAAVSAIFRGLWPAVKSALSAGVAGVISWLKGQGDEMGKMTLDGLIAGIKAGAARVLKAITDLAGGLVSGFMDAIDAHSPSKVFEQIGQWITMGLASGIQKADYKAVEALAKIIAQMSAVASGLADFGKKIAEMIVPSDQQIAAAKEKYLRMTMILTDFIKSISYLGALLPVANVSKAEPGQVRAINAGLTQLSQSFPAIKELQGMTADKLLTGGEASWASMLADTVGKISGVWGGIADSMTKIATAKFPTDDQLQSIKESTIRIATWAMGVLDQDMISSVGAEEFAKAIKGVVDALATVAGLALDKIAAVTDAQLQVAGASLTSLATWAREMMVDWLTIMPDAKARAEFVGQLQEFATMIKSAADIVKSADIGDLSKMVVLQVTSFGPVKDALGRMQQLTTEIVQAWAKGAGDAAAREKWITDLKDFAATMSAAADILKIAAIGEIKAALEYNADALTDVLARLRDQLQPAMAAIVAGWTLTNEQAALATERMKAFSDWIGAALSLAKLADVGKLVGEIEVDVIEIRAVLKWVRDNLAPEMAMVADAWKMASEEAERQTARMKEFGDWIGASIGLAKLADIGTLNGEVEADVIELRAVLKWVRDKLAPEMVMVADAWSVASKEAERQTARMKEFSDWISASIGMAKLANVGTLVGEIEADYIELRAVLNWVKDKLAPEMVAIAEAWGHTAESSKPIIEKMQAFGAFVAAAVGLAKSADLSELTSVTGVSGLAGKLEIVKTNILAMYGMLGEIAKDISVEEANARAALATALGSIGGGLGDFGGGIGGIMELVQSKLFGSDASRGGLGHTQRTKTNRADFFATQLTDTVKRAVQAVQDALAGISIQPNDPKVTAIGQLGEAFGKLADGLTKLAETKLPDAGQLAAIMAATGGASLALAGAGGGGAGPTVTGMGGGDMYIQYGNNVIVTDADDQAGLIEALKATIR